MTHTAKQLEAARDEAVRTADEMTRTRDEATRTRDEAIRTRDDAIRTRDEAIRTRSDAEQGLRELLQSVPVRMWVRTYVRRVNPHLVYRLLSWMQPHDQAAVKRGDRHV
jgi:hypothetical protein